ncbi:aldehyde dehydrogenase family protein [Deinococcus radiopugnans]|uniref:aldehyde dehydrogenase family protein n=1 Tax=Deinococcus radiopugnans TaxID=57497 RepID=UPI00361AA89B
MVVKAHPAHPATSKLAAEAIRAAAQQCGLPAGVFGIVYEDGHELGVQLVQHPDIHAVGFTGSRAGAWRWWPPPRRVRCPSPSTPR